MVKIASAQYILLRLLPLTSLIIPRVSSLSIDRCTLVYESCITFAVWLIVIKGLVANWSISWLGSVVDRPDVCLHHWWFCFVAELVWI